MDQLAKFSSKVSPVHAGLAAVTALAIAGLAVYSLNKKDGDKMLPALTEEETVAIMTTILDKLKLSAARMVKAAENIKQQLAQQGQEMEDKVIMANFILPHFETAFKEIESQVYEDKDVEEHEVEEATYYYIEHGNATLKEVGEKIRLIYKEFGGEVEESADFEVDQTGASQRSSVNLGVKEIVGVLNSIGEKMSNATDGYIETFVQTYGSPNSPELLESFQTGMIALSEEAESAALKAIGVSQSEFQQAIMKHQDSYEIQNAVMVLQMQNQQALQSHGINMM